MSLTMFVQVPVAAENGMQEFGLHHQQLNPCKPVSVHLHLVQIAVLPMMVLNQPPVLNCALAKTTPTRSR